MNWCWLVYGRDPCKLSLCWDFFTLILLFISVLIFHSIRLRFVHFWLKIVFASTMAHTFFDWRINAHNMYFEWLIPSHFLSLSVSLSLYLAIIHSFSLSIYNFSPIYCVGWSWNVQALGFSIELDMRVCMCVSLPLSISISVWMFVSIWVPINNTLSYWNLPRELHVNKCSNRFSDTFC